MRRRNFDNSMTHPMTPPRLRSRVALGLATPAAQGRFALQHCGDCGKVQFPPQEFCSECLGTALNWRPCSRKGALVAEATLHHSLDAAFSGDLPLRTGLVHHESGAVLVAFLHPRCVVERPVRLALTLDRGGNAVVTATPEDEDEMMSRCTYSPKGRTCLVTDGSSALGQAVMSALSAAGAADVLSTPEDCSEADIVVDTAWLSDDLGDLGALGRATSSLADRLIPSLIDRNGAWVSVLSFAALAPYPTCPEHSARMASAQALAVGLRARLHAGGAGALALYPAQPKVARACAMTDQSITAEKLANAVVTALETGREETFPDALSQLWSERLAGERKALEREFALAVK